MLTRLWARMAGGGRQLEDNDRKSNELTINVLAVPISALCCKREKRLPSSSCLGRIRHSDPYLVIIDPY